MGIALLAAILLPALQGELDAESGALEGNLGVLEELDALSLRGFVAGFAERLRAGERMPAAELQVLLQDELQTQWQADGETALAQRSDASRLLQAVHGVEAAMTAASAEVKEALVRGLADLGEQFGEFRWMLAGLGEMLSEMRARQALQLALQVEQLDLQRQHMERTELLVELHRRPPPDDWPAPAWEAAGEPRMPAFVEEGAPDFGPRPVFVARERELARLEFFLDEVLAGRGRVVFVTGGPGRGKTALLSEFARRAMVRHKDLLVTSGSCNAFSGAGDPYLPFREVMGMLSGDVQARWASGLVSGDHARRLWGAIPEVAQALLRRGPNTIGVLVDGPALLARATTATGGEAPWLDPSRQAVGRQQGAKGGSSPGGLEQSHLFEQCTNVLRTVSESHPLLLILDDLQWADSASLDLLFHLGRRLAGSRVLIAGAYRPEEVALDRDAERHPRVRERHPLEKVAGRAQAPVWRHRGRPGPGRPGWRDRALWMPFWTPSPTNWATSSGRRFSTTPGATPCSPSSCCGRCRSGATWSGTKRDGGWQGRR